MASTKLKWLMILLAGVLVPLASTGCVPVTAFNHKSFEDKAYVQERYARVPILGPITNGGSIRALDPPSDDEVWWALERARPVQGGIPFLHETQRNNVRIVTECVADYVDPPRVIPLIGPVQLHHAHYKCTVYFSERKIIGWPYNHMIEDEDTREVVYIDHNHFHMVGPVSTDIDCDCY